MPFRSSCTVAPASTPLTSNDRLTALVTLSLMAAPLSLPGWRSGGLGVSGTTSIEADAANPSTVADALPAPLAAPTVQRVGAADDASSCVEVGLTVPFTPPNVTGSAVGL